MQGGKGAIGPPGSPVRFVINLLMTRRQKIKPVRWGRQTCFINSPFVAQDRVIFPEPLVSVYAIESYYRTQLERDYISTTCYGTHVFLFLLGCDW